MRESGISAGHVVRPAVRRLLAAGGVDTGPGVGLGFMPPEVEQRALAVYEEVVDVAAI